MHFPVKVAHSLHPILFHLVPPSIRAVPTSGQMTARKGGSATLECKASGNPVPSIHWTKKVIFVAKFVWWPSRFIVFPVWQLINFHLVLLCFRPPTLALDQTITLCCCFCIWFCVLLDSWDAERARFIDPHRRRLHSHVGAHRTAPGGNLPVQCGQWSRRTGDHGDETGHSLWVQQHPCNYYRHNRKLLSADIIFVSSACGFVEAD